MLLFRPVGKAEFELIEKTNYNAFPPRLPQQNLLKMRCVLKAEMNRIKILEVYKQKMLGTEFV